ELSVEQHDGDAVVTVRDNGMGIVAAALPHLFDPRKRIDEPHDDAGLGIGLSLVKKLVELHGGTIEAHSTGAGQDATFVVRLPCTTAAPARGADSSGSDPQTPRRRILIVDDNDDAAASLAKLLEHAGHEVRDVRDGRSALDIVREFAPDVVLLDIGLPDMDGWELARALRSDYKIGPIKHIDISGYGQAADRRRSRDAGIDQHLTKPVDYASIAACL